MAYLWGGLLPFTLGRWAVRCVSLGPSCTDLVSYGGREGTREEEGGREGEGKGGEGKGGENQRKKGQKRETNTMI